MVCTVCPKCGQTISDSAMELCPHCGAVLPTVSVLSKEKSEQSHVSELYDDAVRCVCTAGYATTSLLQRHLKLGYSAAASLMDQLEIHGVIGPYQGNKPREVLISHKAAIPATPTDFTGVKVETSDPPPRQNSGLQTPPGGVSLSACDAMEGHDFEYLCAAVLEANGFVNVTVTKASGDQGIDVLAEKSGSRYAIQCKCYDSPVGNHAVQEAFSGAAFYDGRIPVVMTNQVFTAAARELAAKIKVVLWDRGELERLLAIYNSVTAGIPLPAASSRSYQPPKDHSRAKRGFCWVAGIFCILTFFVFFFSLTGLFSLFTGILLLPVQRWQAFLNRVFPFGRTGKIVVICLLYAIALLFYMNPETAPAAAYTY